jgi:hypothetical protein
LTKKKQTIVLGQKSLSGFVGFPEPVVEEPADVSRTRIALTFNDNWLKDPQYKWLYRDQDGNIMFCHPASLARPKACHRRFSAFPVTSR